MHSSGPSPAQSMRSSAVIVDLTTPAEATEPHSPLLESVVRAAFALDHWVANETPGYPSQRQCQSSSIGPSGRGESWKERHISCAPQGPACSGIDSEIRSEQDNPPTALCTSSVELVDGELSPTQVCAEQDTALRHLPGHEKPAAAHLVSNTAQSVRLSEHAAEASRLSGEHHGDGSESKTSLVRSKWHGSEDSEHVPLPVRPLESPSAPPRPKRARITVATLPALESARTILRDIWGHHDFTPTQAPVIASVLRGSDVFAMLPTGGGSRFCTKWPQLRPLVSALWYVHY